MRIFDLVVAIRRTAAGSGGRRQFDASTYQIARHVARVVSISSRRVVPLHASRGRAGAWQKKEQGRAGAAAEAAVDGCRGRCSDGQVFCHVFWRFRFRTESGNRESKWLRRLCLRPGGRLRAKLARIVRSKRCARPHLRERSSRMADAIDRCRIMRQRQRRCPHCIPLWHLTRSPPPHAPAQLARQEEASSDLAVMRVSLFLRSVRISTRMIFQVRRSRPMNLPQCRLVLRPAPQAAFSDHRTWFAALHVGEIHRGAQARRRPHQDEDGRAAARRRRFRRPLVQVPFSYIC